MWTMDERDFLAARFEQHRPHLRAVAYRMLGSLSEADDAVQEAWLRLSRTDADAVDNLGGWLTTVVGRVCLNMLRSRTYRREQPLDTDAVVRVPDPVLGGPIDPEQEAILADSVGIALLVVLETLNPAERLAFVLHDLFSMPFDEIAPVIGRTEPATRQLASRARRRVQGAAPRPETDPARQREVVDAFLAAARGGDIEALVAVLDPDVVVRSDGGTLRPSGIIRGARSVAEGAVMFARIAEHTRLITVNGGPGAVAIVDGKPVSVAAFTIVNGRIAELNILTDPERLAGLDWSALGG
jgi:RNA polymerase sigma factor (sigma-70 family)